MAAEETIRVRFEADVAEAEAQVRRIERTVDQATRSIDNSISRAEGRVGGGRRASGGLAATSRFNELRNAAIAVGIGRAIEQTVVGLENIRAPGGPADAAAAAGANVIRGAQGLSVIPVAGLSEALNKALEFGAERLAGSSFFDQFGLFGAARAIGFGTGSQELIRLQDEAAARREKINSSRKPRETSFADIGFSQAEANALRAAGFSPEQALPAGGEIVQILKRIEQNTSSRPAAGNGGTIR